MRNPIIKNLAIFFLYSIFLCFFINDSLAQKWTIGGDMNLFGNQPNLGPSINQPLNLITNGTTRLRINNNNGATRGFVALGRISPIHNLY